MRRRKPVYPPAKTATKGGSATSAAPARTGTSLNGPVSINLAAINGRSDIRQGTRVRIAGGMHEGAVGVVESVVGGVIPAVVVRTTAGQARRVRTVDLRPEPDPGSGPAPGPESDPGDRGSTGEPDVAS